MRAEAPQPVDRHLPTEEARDLLELTRDLADGRSRPRAAEEEDAGRFPREVFATHRRGRPARPALPEPSTAAASSRTRSTSRSLEELAAARLTVGLGGQRAHPVLPRGRRVRQQAAAHRTPAARCSAATCSAPTACPSPAPAPTRPACAPGPCATATSWRLDGTKAWITHGGVADFYTVMARTGGQGAHGITAFLVPGDAEGLSAAPPERKMGMKGSPTAQVHFDGVRVRRRPPGRRRGPGLRHRAGRAGLRPARHRGLRRRAGPGGAGRRAGVRHASAGSSASPIADFQGLRLHARRHGHPVSRRAGRCTWRPPGCATRACRSASRPPWPSCFAHRHRDEGDHRRGPAARRVRLHGRLPGRSATCARRRCCRSSRAPTRSSGW